MERICDMLRRSTVGILFVVIYTAAFYLLSRLFRLFLPFLLGCALYFLTAPLVRLIRHRTRLSTKFSAYAATAIGFAAIAAVLALLIVLLCREAVHLLSGESYFRFHELLPQVRGFLSGIFSRLPELTKNLTGDLSGTFSTLLPYAGNALRLFLSVPAAMIIPILAFSFTCWIHLHRHRLRRLVSAVIGPRTHLRLRHTFRAQSANTSGVIFSYGLIYLTTFAESGIVLYLLKMPYPLITALIVTVSDVFPVLGPGAVLLPLSLYRVLCGAYAQAIGLFAGWLLITVIRQIIEPRLISKISRTPGITMLTAVYASFIFGNFWIIPYTALLFYLYQTLCDAGILTHIAPKKRKAAD